MTRIISTLVVMLGFSPYGCQKNAIGISFNEGHAGSSSGQVRDSSLLSSREDKHWIGLADRNCIIGHLLSLEFSEKHH